MPCVESKSGLCLIQRSLCLVPRSWHHKSPIVANPLNCGARKRKFIDSELCISVRLFVLLPRPFPDPRLHLISPTCSPKVKQRSAASNHPFRVSCQCNCPNEREPNGLSCVALNCGHEHRLALAVPPSRTHPYLHLRNSGHGLALPSPTRCLLSC